MNYRFVALTSSGEAGHAEDWSCASDVEAMERAARQAPAFGAELWRGDERIAAYAGPMGAARSDAAPEARP